MSPLALTPMEFLDIHNMDFQKPGSLYQRWGSTQYISQTFAGRINSLYEYSKLSGASYIVTSHSGGIWFGATTGTYQGMSLSNFSTYVSSFILNSFVDIIWGNLTGFGIQLGPVPFLGNFRQQFNPGLIGDPAGGTGAVIIDGYLQTDNTFSYAVLNDYLFAADGNKFFKFNGSTTSYVSVPPLITQRTDQPIATNTPGTTTIGVGVTTGGIAFYGSFVNQRGFEGQIWPIVAIQCLAYANAASFGGSFIPLRSLINVPNNYDIQSINLYAYWTSATMAIGLTTTWNQPYGLVANYPLSTLGITFNVSVGQTTYILPLGSTVGGQTLLNSNAGPLPDAATNTYFPLGFTLISGETFGGIGYINGWHIANFSPRYLETFQNRLFLSGFSTAPSTVYFSDTAEPEGFALDANFEVRTNDSDVIRAMRSYSTRLYIFKTNSLHVLSGDTPENFFLQEISDQYGALNHRCAIVYTNLLAFLDRKGVVVFNGSNLQILSTKVQPYFDLMNYDYALNQACMVHDKLRNQIMVAFPYNGATTNNITLVYDYVVNAWTTYKGFNPTVFDMIQGYNNTRYPMFGDLSGRLNWSGPSMLFDNGSGVTTFFKTRFIHDLGDSIQKQFRRLYVNGDQQGVTLGLALNFYQDYGASIVYSTTLTLGSFQERIDFGISAKSLAFEMAAVATVQPLHIHGFTIEQRMQRRV